MAAKQPVAVSPSDRRRRLASAALDAFVTQIVEQFDPEEIVLFGSYAYGEPDSDSDVDVMVVMETPLKEVEQAVRICLAIDQPFPLDLIVCTPATLARRLALGDPFLREVVERGRVLYARADG